MTDYRKLYEQPIALIERQGEKGSLPANNLSDFLDKIFYPGS